MVVGKSPEWLPSGFTEKVKYKSGRKIKVYTEVSSGKKFYSMASVTQYLNTVDHANTMTVQTKCDNVDEPLPHMSPQSLSMTNRGGIPEEKKEGNSFKMLDKVDKPSPKCLSMTNTGGTPEENKGNSFKTIDKVDEPSPHMTPQCLSMTNTGSVPREKKKGDSFKPVATESSVADDLPPGWIKEIITSKTGNKIRKDPYYTDPVSGYVFRSKLDALRYLKTNDIRSCTCRPKKKESGDLNLVKNEIPCDNVDEPLPHMSPQSLSVTNTGGIPEEKKEGNSFKMLDKVDEPSPKCLSMTNAGGTPEENKGNSFKTIDKVDEPSPHMTPQCLSMTNTGSVPREKKKGNSFKPVATESSVADDLPPGWIKEIITSKSGNKIRKDPYYTDPVSGYVFRSKLDALRYLKTNDIRSCTCRPKKRESGDLNLVKNEIPCDNVDEPLPHMSPQSLSMTNTGGIPEEKKDGNSFKMLDKVDEPSPKCLSMTNTGGTPEENKGNSFKTIDKVDEPSPHMTPQCLSMTNTGSVPREKKKGNSFKPVATESSVADDLPPGWIKEIITSKSGNKIRKDPYYTDPVSGYVFRSKLDALRYLKTNDIRSCTCRPKKWESGDLNLVKNEIPSSSQAHEKLPEHKRQLFVGGESNDCGESSGTKSLANSEAKILKQTISNNDSDSVQVTSAGADCLEEKISYENPLKNTEMQINLEPENDVSKDEPTVMDVCPPVIDRSTKQQPSECGTEKQTEKTHVNLKNPRKRKVSGLPSRTSKRLSRSEPKMPSNSELSKHSLRAAAKRSSGSEVNNASSASVPLPSDIEPTKEASDHAAFVGEETPKAIEPPNEIKNRLIENPIIPEEQTDGNASENKQESQLCFDFGDSWSDPLEFALKTLRGEIPIDDPLTFLGCFNENLSIPCNNNQLDGSLRPSQSVVPNIFQNEVAPNSGSSKQQSGVDPLPSNSSSFSALGNIGFPAFSGFNNQASTDVGKKDSQSKFNP